MTEPRTLYARRGQCRSCMRRRQVLSIGRTGGGNWRRGGRWYSSSICVECARSLAVLVGSHPGARADGFSGSELRKINEARKTGAIVWEEE